MLATLLRRARRREMPNSAPPVSIASAPANPARVLRTLSELDRALDEADVAGRESDDALRAAFGTFEFRPSVDGLPPDPFSAAYRDYQFKLYEQIAGKPYAVSNEACAFLVDPAIATPFPYYTRSFQTVSDQLLMVGLIIKTMRLPPGASILEFGPGWGNTTVALARMGYSVTALDIESRFLEVIRGRCAGMPHPPELIAGDFSAAAGLGKSFDAVLFYECFHHCADHHRLLDDLARLVAPGGQAVFAAEPITDIFPMPWGIRTDGESLWAIRRFGWLELGFRESYFRETLRRVGWKVRRHDYDVTPLGTIFVATRDQ